MSLDISPDGKTIVFDLVGDIYTMPITGGAATLILGGAAYEHAAALLAGRKAHRIRIRSRWHHERLDADAQRKGPAAGQQG